MGRNKHSKIAFFGLRRLSSASDMQRLLSTPPAVDDATLYDE